jgi:hypothetical protein
MAGALGSYALVGVLVGCQSMRRLRGLLAGYSGPDPAAATAGSQTLYSAR